MATVVVPYWTQLCLGARSNGSRSCISDVLCNLLVGLERGNIAVGGDQSYARALRPVSKCVTSCSTNRASQRRESVSVLCRCPWPGLAALYVSRLRRICVSFWVSGGGTFARPQGAQGCPVELGLAPPCRGFRVAYAAFSALVHLSARALACWSMPANRSGWHSFTRFR